MMWILVILAAAAAYAVGVMRQSSAKPVSQPEPKTFGLDEARAARDFIQTPEQAKAVKAVVVGVLKYEDAVAEEADDEAGELLQTKGSNEQRISGYLESIVGLNASIADLQNVNAGIDAQRADLVALQKLFA